MFLFTSPRFLGYKVLLNHLLFKLRTQPMGGILEKLKATLKRNVKTGEPTDISFPSACR